MKPFFRSAGGKTGLSGYIVDMFPMEWEVYWEPFLGGGGVFFELARRGALQDRYVVLSDADTAVTDLFRAVRDDPQAVFEQCEEWCEVIRWQETEADRRGAYDCLRDCWSSGADRAPGTQLALRTLCFNGLWRTNRAGAFNVPPDPKRLENPPVPTLEALQAVQEALGMAVQTRILGESVFACACEPGPGWVVYCDPPYSATWRKYGTDNAFSWEDQLALIDACARWHEAGARVRLSNNNDEKLVREIEKRWPKSNIEFFEVAQNISGPVKGRKPRDEILVHA